MSIDAMYWVWNHSRSKGTGRHVMLACANWITGPECTVRASTAELVQFSNAARSSVIKAVDALVKSGELQLLEEGCGTRAALYRIPGAVGYLRPERGARGPKTGPLDESQQSGNETPSQNPRGPDSGPQGSENETPRGPESGPHNQDHRNHEEEEASSAAGREITAEEKLEFGRFWQLHPKSRDMDKTKAAWAAAVRDGVDPKKITAAAQAYAHEVVNTEFRYIKQSDRWVRERRYEDKFAPPTPAPGSRPQLRAVSGGWRPFQNPENHDVYDEPLI
ncbi:hypothetical protein ACIRF8_15170 [Streptomyces sp. NPDC102406]|uniref:hypothetical protein n=1 Tax=Streptomyces sp. NPDC102406 TaxID=3366171 RepID=UPI003806D293